MRIWQVPTQLYYKVENERIISFSTDITVVAVTAITLLEIGNFDVLFKAIESNCD